MPAIGLQNGGVRPFSKKSHSAVRIRASAAYRFTEGSYCVPHDTVHHRRGTAPSSLNLEGLIMRASSVCCLAAAAIFAMGNRAEAALLTDTQAQRDFTGFFDGPLRITYLNSPFDFTGQDYDQLTTIDKMVFTLTVEDGDTVSGAFDYNHWTLGLDGVDTGLVLNGFLNSWTAQTIEFKQVPVDTQDQILEKLQEDGLLVPTIIDTNPNGTNDYGDNKIGLCYDPHNTILTLEGQDTQIPEPSTMVIWSLLGASVAGFAWRRRRVPA